MLDALPPSAPARPVTYECFAHEAARQQLDLYLLLAVMKAEGGKVGVVSKNTNKTLDLGPMQVNTVNAGLIAKVSYGVDTEATRKAVVTHLIYDGCANIAAGAWMLKKRILESDGDIWRGVGRYHSPNTPALANRYSDRVKKHYKDILNQLQNQRGAY